MQFKNFTFYGRRKDFESPRDKSMFPLMHIDEIVSSFKESKPYFLFINCPETHIPYDNPESIITADYLKLVARLHEEQKGKRWADVKSLPFSTEELDLLKSFQKLSLEWTDRRLKELFEKLPDNGLPTLYIVCGDHGEEFGEGGRFGHGHVHDTVMTVPLWIGLR
jgi:hypothetical protein